MAYYPANMQQNNERNPMWYNPMFYGPQQLNYHYQYVWSFPVVYYVPQYIVYYIPQYVVYNTPEYAYNTTTTQIINNDQPASDGYSPCIECKDIEIQTNKVATTDTISAQTNVEQKDIAIQCYVATKQQSVETISIKKIDIEIETNILESNSISIQTDPCITIKHDVNQSKELSPEEESKKYIVIMEPIDDLNLISCLRTRSAYEGQEEVQVSTTNDSRPVKKKNIQFNDWLNKVKII